MVNTDVPFGALESSSEELELSLLEESCAKILQKIRLAWRRLSFTFWRKLIEEQRLGLWATKEVEAEPQELTESDVFTVSEYILSSIYPQSGVSSLNGEEAVCYT